MDEFCNLKTDQQTIRSTWEWDWPRMENQELSAN